VEDYLYIIAALLLEEIKERQIWEQFVAGL